MHDAKSQISVKGEKWQDQYNELWNMLVPGNGKANTIQGEMIRIVGKRLTVEMIASIFFLLRRLFCCNLFLGIVNHSLVGVAVILIV